MPRARRVLANVPTYMIFDDHDVTDDWNLTEEWRRSARASETGRRIVANALASYWAFQGWGNDPSDDDVRLARVVARAAGHEDAGAYDDYDSALWDYDGWSYFVPTDPPVVVLDSRTQRSYDSPDGAARLVGHEGLRRAAHVARRAGHDKGRRLLIVSAVPVFGFELQERRQKYLVDKVGPYEIDFEAWHSNLRGLVDLMRWLIEELEPSECVLLSGDVHYAVNARAFFSVGERELAFVQLVSSGFKHAGVAARTALDVLGHLLHERHERLGWDEPPDHKAPAAIGKRLIGRTVNTDEWSADSPVFLAPRDLRLLGIEHPPDYRECRIYVRPEGRRRSILIGENNVGLVSITRDGVVHRVLSRGRTRTNLHRAQIDFPLSR
jgi:hypothetical protein